MRLSLINIYVHLYKIHWNNRQKYFIQPSTQLPHATFLFSWNQNQTGATITLRILKFKSFTCDDSLIINHLQHELWKYSKVFDRWPGYPDNIIILWWAPAIHQCSTASVGNSFIVTAVISCCCVNYSGRVANGLWELLNDGVGFLLVVFWKMETYLRF